MLALDHWCSRIKELVLGFCSFFCQHTYKEHNRVVDRLSKEALDLAAGNLIVQEYLEDAMSHEHTFNFSF